MQHIFYSDSIDLNIELDISTRLPLISEKNKIRELVLNYLPLPYSIAEYGCGKKCSMIINKLLQLGIPSYAIQRGMIMEYDMSPAALAEQDFYRRPHALQVENAIFHVVNFDNAMLLRHLDQAGIEANREKHFLQAGEFRLSHQKTLQFIEARSHIFVILAFWDNAYNQVREFVIDPTIDREELFWVTQLRKYLQASEALIFTAPILGEFQLEERYMTELQRRRLYRMMPDEDMQILDSKQHKELILAFNQAAPGSIGDPYTWTYANNMPVSDQKQQDIQRLRTGKGNAFRQLFKNLALCRTKYHEEEVVNVLSKLIALEDQIDIRHIIAADSLWSEEQLAPLKKVVDGISNFVALDEIAERLRNGVSLYRALGDKRGLNSLFGVVFRLRERIEQLARVSRDNEGRLNAIAFSEPYLKAARALIRQMNRAGLSVCIDKVGNIHGLLLESENTLQILQSLEISSLKKNGAENKRNVLCLCSHLDTVTDGGKYDGRLGVLSGIEVAEIIYGLKKWYNFADKFEKNGNILMVSAFIGEEMSFTGRGVSMPGSAAVAGIASMEQVYAMTNERGESFRSQLIKMLRFLKDCQINKEIELLNDFMTKDNDSLDDSFDDYLLDQCFLPQKFFSCHSYERHIEQGSALHEKQVPMLVVNTIMGIYQEDYIFKGPKAEEAAMQFNLALRQMSLTGQANIRLSVGILTPYPEKSGAVSEAYEKESIGKVSKDNHRVNSKQPGQDMVAKNEDPIKMEYLQQGLHLDFGLRVHLSGQKGHAGGMPVLERKDAGVAISRLAVFFYSLQDELQQIHGQPLILIAGAPLLLPGCNRNVIPGEASLTLGVIGENLGQPLKRILQQKIQAYIVGELSLGVSHGGEGIQSHQTHEVTYVNKCNQIRLSLDIRYDKKSKLDQLLLQISQELNEKTISNQVTIKRQIEQQLDPYPLQQSGQVLQIERSYGGSHNPLETELARDVLRGTLLQLAVSLDFLAKPEAADWNLFEFVLQKMPDIWKERLSDFTSGALHDSCNIAAACKMLA